MWKSWTRIFTHSSVNIQRGSILTLAMENESRNQATAIATVGSLCRAWLKKVKMASTQKTGEGSIYTVMASILTFLSLATPWVVTLTSPTDYRDSDAQDRLKLHLIITTATQTLGPTRTHKETSWVCYRLKMSKFDSVRLPHNIYTVLSHHIKCQQTFRELFFPDNGLQLQHCLKLDDLVHYPMPGWVFKAMVVK